MKNNPVVNFIIIIGIIIGIGLFWKCCRDGGCCGNKTKPPVPPLPPPPVPQPDTIIIRPIYPVPAPTPVGCSSEFKGYDTNGHRNHACGIAPCNPDRNGYDIYGRINPDCKTVPPPPPPHNNVA